MNAWDGPGDGWREISGTAQQPDLVQYDDGLPIRLWVREEPVPPLPTSPYTVIRVTWGDGMSTTEVFMLDEDEGWLNSQGEPVELPAGIVGFEVLAEPQWTTTGDTP